MSKEDFKTHSDWSGLEKGLGNPSLRGSFINLVAKDLAHTKYHQLKEVDNLFLRTDSNKKRRVLSSFDSVTEEKNERESNQEFIDNIIFIFNDYIKSLNLKKEEDRCRLWTLIVIFLNRSIRRDFELLNLPPEYALFVSKFIGSFDMVLRKLFHELNNAVDNIDTAELPNVNAVSIARKYFRSSKGVWLVDNPDAIDIDKESERSTDITIFSERLERLGVVDYFNVDPAKGEKVKLMAEKYRSIFYKLYPSIDIDILAELVPPSEGTYYKYKKIVSQDLIRFSSNFNHDDVVNYLVN
jgi:stage V sporulation protein SpoVS